MLPHFGRQWFAQHWHLRVSFLCCAQVNLALLSSMFFYDPFMFHFVDQTDFYLLNICAGFGKSNFQYHISLFRDVHITLHQINSMAVVRHYGCTFMSLTTVEFWAFSQSTFIINFPDLNWPGTKTIRGALAMPMMIQGFKKDLIKYSIITCRKPEWWGFSTM